jgi:oxygen-dependent protoporphyrinogen oxidase
MLDIKGQPEFVRVIRHQQGLPQYHLGHQQRLATIREQLQLTPGLYLCGNYLDGVSVRDCVARGRHLAARIASDVGRGGRLSLIPAARSPAAPRRAAG